LPDNVKLYLKPVLFSAFVMKHMLVDVDGKSEFCLKCGSRATQEALFNVEKYCDTCAEKEANRSRKISP
jgi:hypothetical protein